MKKLLLSLGLIPALTQAADPTLMVLQVTWSAPVGGVSPTGYIMQKPVMSGANTNWVQAMVVAAPATNMMLILPYTPNELDWRLAATNFYGTSEWTYARSPVPTPGVGEAPLPVVNLKIIRK